MAALVSGLGSGRRLRRHRHARLQFLLAFGDDRLARGKPAHPPPPWLGLITQDDYDALKAKALGL